MLPLVVPSVPVVKPTCSSHLTELYDSRAFITHAALLRQAFAHCAIFPTAASRRSLDRVSVPVWPITLSGRLTIVALVGCYPANKLMVRELIYKRNLRLLWPRSIGSVVLSGISTTFVGLSRIRRQIIHVLLTRPPLYSGTRRFPFSLDLHVLGTPPAFVLSQDQTLQL